MKATTRAATWALTAALGIMPLTLTGCPSGDEDKSDAPVDLAAEKKAAEEEAAKEITEENAQEQLDALTKEIEAE